MATAKDTNEEDRRNEDLEKEISELWSARKALFEKKRPIDEELERLALRERKYFYELHRRKEEQYDIDIQRLVALESELMEIKQENSKQLDRNSKLKKSLDQATRQSRKHLRKISELQRNNTVEQRESDLADNRAAQRSKTVDISRVGELEKQLSHVTELLKKAKHDFTAMRQRLSEVQERLTIAEQVTAATQQRELQESGNTDELAEVQLQLMQQPASHAETGGSDVVRAKYSELTTTLDARIVAVNMYQRNALTLRELQSIQSLGDRPVEAAEMLLNIILEQPDAVYLCFLDVLKHIELQHIYSKLVEDKADQSSHTPIIRAHYVSLLETLDVKFSGLVSQLFSDQVISGLEREDIRAEKTSFRANEKLLSVLSRKSPQQFQLFLDALDNTGQHHIREKIDDQTGHQRVQSRISEQRDDREKDASVYENLPVQVTTAASQSEGYITPTDYCFLQSRETATPVYEPLQNVAAAAASQTDEDVTARELSFLQSLGEMVHYFLAHTIDIKRGNLTDKLAVRDVLSPAEKQKIRLQRKTEAKVDILLKVLREKSASKFESFLTALGETGQQPVADVVIQALRTADQAAVNPLHYLCVGQVVHTLPEGEPVYGVTSLGDSVYVLRWKDSHQVEVYDVNTFSLQRCITVPNAEGFVDMTSCAHVLCLYITDDIVQCVHRVGLNVRDNASSATRWPVNDRPAGLSLNAAHNVLVTCFLVCKIKEFSSQGDLLREVTLPYGVIVDPFHTIQLPGGELVVCHGGTDDAVNRVVVTTADGQQLLRSQWHSGQTRSHTHEYNVPRHLAADTNGSVLVVDFHNRRVELLSQTLEYVRQVMSPDQFKWWPQRLCLDVVKRRLYVADTAVTATGRVVVFNL